MYNGISYYGYMYSVCTDLERGCIRRYAVTLAHLHDSKMLPHLVDPETELISLWADSPYSGEDS